MMCRSFKPNSIYNIFFQNQKIWLPSEGRSDSVSYTLKKTDIKLWTGRSSVLYSSLNIRAFKANVSILSEEYRTDSPHTTHNLPVQSLYQSFSEYRIQSRFSPHLATNVFGFGRNQWAGKPTGEKKKEPEMLLSDC